MAEGLVTHGINTDLLCQGCLKVSESVGHAMFLCPRASRVWELANIPSPCAGFSGDIHADMKYLLDLIDNLSLPVSRKLAIPWILWGIWKNRNAFVFDKKKSDLNLVVTHAFEESDLWQKAKDKQISLSKTNLVPYSNLLSYWIRPVAGMLKCNLSVSWLNEVSMIGGVLIVRDSRGDVLFHARDAFMSSSSRLEAELRVIEWVLRSLRDLSLQDIEIWSVSSKSLSVIQNSRKWPRFRGYSDRILRLSRFFRKLKWCLSHFKANYVVRDIARSVTRESRLKSYISIGGPTWLLSRIRDESLS